MSMRFRPTGRAVGVLLLALVLIASGCGGDDDDDSSSATSSGSGATLDTTLVFGGPPECLERPLCLGDKEQELYGLDFKEVKKLDPGGPVTVKALQDGTIDVGLLFTGRYVDGIFPFVMGLDRWVLRAFSYLLLLTDEYPPFRLDQGGADPSPGTRTA